MNPNGRIHLPLVGGAIVRYKAGRLDHYAQLHQAGLAADAGPDA